MSELIIAERSDIVSIANAVRNKIGTTEEMTLGEIITNINGIGVGVELPELTNPADEAKIFSGYEVIDETGSKITGTFTIDSELDAQDNLLEQIQNALETKAAGGGVELPDLDNPATAENLEAGYQMIDGSGNVVIGTHTDPIFILNNNILEII
jgi:hypothetical protein